MNNPLPPSIPALEARLGLTAGTLDTEDAARAEAALQDATEDALSYVPAATATSWRSDAPGIVRVVILKAARREYDNPQGFRQEGLGEHSATVADASGASLNRAEVAKIRRVAGLAGFTGSVRTPSAYSAG